MEEEHDMSNLRVRRKKSGVGITCCFSGTTVKHLRRASFDAPSPLRSPSAWFKSKASDLPEIKGKCRNFISRMGRHRRHSSAEFSYDPLSYALNFDDDQLSPHDDYGTTTNFTARLPVSPPRREGKLGNEDLRRGFEALSIMNMKRGASSAPHAVDIKVAGQRRNKGRELSSSPRGVRSRSVVEADESSSTMETNCNNYNGS
ncbi:hypothetical protein ABFS82_01G001000 [Erythranthe guttata]